MSTCTPVPLFSPYTKIHYVLSILLGLGQAVVHERWFGYGSAQNYRSENFWLVLIAVNALRVDFRKIASFRVSSVTVDFTTRLLRFLYLIYTCGLQYACVLVIWMAVPLIINFLFESWGRKRAKYKYKSAWLLRELGMKLYVVFILVVLFLNLF